MGNHASSETGQPEFKRATLDMIRNYKAPSSLQAEANQEEGSALLVNFNIIKSSVSFKALEEDPNLYELRFEVNSLCDCKVEVLYHVREELDAADQFIRYSSHRFSQLNEVYDPVNIEFPAGMRQALPSKAILVDVESYERSAEVFKMKHHFPVAITLMRSGQSSSESMSMTLCFKLSKPSEDQGYTATIACHKLHLNGQSWTLLEIFGLKTNIPEDDRNCVVCLTDAKDTAILPCRHMCLCCGCAKVMRGQLTAKCPICRTAGTSFLQIKID
jgi:hypothetical protein